MAYTVTLTTSTGYIFVNGFDTLEEARSWMAGAPAVMLPGETLKLEKI